MGQQTEFKKKHRTLKINKNIQRHTHTKNFQHINK